MEVNASFVVQKIDLLNVLKQMQKVETSARKKLSTLEVTVIDDFLQMSIPGIQLKIKAVTKGSAKFTIRLWYFADIVKSEQDSTLHFELSENRLRLRGLSFPVLTTFFETDRILRSIDLPLNYTNIDLTKLILSEKYTDEELLFNNLDREAAIAIRKVKADIGKISLLLCTYGFNTKEVEQLILNKIKQMENADS